MLKQGASTAALLLLLESCGDGGVGGVPIRPDFLTESEARVALNDLFADNGIALTADVPLDVVLSPEDTAHVTLDGYNDSLRVGYEYISDADHGSFTASVCNQLDADAAGEGPYVKPVPGLYTKVHDLEHDMQNFIDTLKAHGTI